jgi:hypothetical protein
MRPINRARTFYFTLFATAFYLTICATHSGLNRKCHVACLWRLRLTEASAKLARAHVHMCLPSPRCKLQSPSL